VARGKCGRSRAGSERGRGQGAVGRTGGRSEQAARPGAQSQDGKQVGPGVQRQDGKGMGRGARGTEPGQEASGARAGSKW
jgi:hypothetical protein